jgi:hypothetical protein
MAVYLTGDTHGSIEMNRLGYKHWPEGKHLTRTDYLIVLGDFGLMFYNELTKEEIYLTRWLETRPYTILFLDGNHENHPRLAALPEETMFGGTVGKVIDNVYHLKRGYVYVIEEKKFFVFGGASSIDRGSRTAGVTWWPEEIPSWEETERGLISLEKHDYKVDFILAHTAPKTVVDMLARSERFTVYDPDPTAKYLEHVCQIAAFSDFYCGHWHKDKNFGKYHLLYKNFVQVI